MQKTDKSAIGKREEKNEEERRSYNNRSCTWNLIQLKGTEDRVKDVEWEQQ